MHGFLLRNTPEYRVFFNEDKTKNKISPWHDIPLFPDPKNKLIVNFVNEIPKHTCEKMEISTAEEFNPIRQDTKKGKLRLYPFASLVNYGCIPQTWEDPSKNSLGLDFCGDNDPIDVVEVGDRVSSIGEVYPVKVLGILGMIDEGEMDWKVVGIDVRDPISARLNSLDDLDKVMPNKVRTIIDWFKFYKVPDGKAVNEFTFNEEGLDANSAVKVIEETNEYWKNKEAIKGAGLWA